MPNCFRCNEPGTQWFDGSEEFHGPNARAICDECEYKDWKITIASLAAPQG